jgi:hypothetical protein
MIELYEDATAKANAALVTTHCGCDAIIMFADRGGRTVLPHILTRDIKVHTVLCISL